MIDLFKKLTLGIVILFSITNFASAETTISAEGQYIFNTLGFYLGGVLAVNIFVFGVSYIAWSVMIGMFGIRLSKEAETKGTDVTETGVIAYAIRD